MLIQAAKVAMVQALKAGYGTTGYTGLQPAFVGIEYPQEQAQWPALLVQFRPSTVEWIGLRPDLYIPDADPVTQYTHLKQGKFDGSYDIMILALSSAERDQLWDRLISLIMFSPSDPPTNQFAPTLDTNDLLDLTYSPDHITPVGDSIGGGVPWDPEAMAYEATVRIEVIGEFLADAATEVLLPISAVKILPYTDEDQPPEMHDGLGPWNPA